ncbi:hypothetical protein K3N28_14120 [Glycomyces sp. TRM65418]|uniref:effector-associated constant component EACC1 n=1 Tax=Glycomyces sp. TRM65418 TaxID=2867006 RepID=UPI001CE60C24|nr:hypothetical protein [Glycomyces sp. TRM65418]MCC3764201.1 hypothetical protein [Glycomyces sp. TRM65418]QZD53885.1 hypothetical protein K3N28_14055 [Glycomyces sp. TRM65418]
MAQLRIDLAAPGQGDLTDLYAWLLEDARTGSMELAAEGADDGSLGLIDTLLAGISTVAGVAALYYTALAFLDNRRMEQPEQPAPELVFTAPDGARLVVANAPKELQEQLIAQFTEHLLASGRDQPGE